jgi:hypothetical protein
MVRGSSHVLSTTDDVDKRIARLGTVTICAFVI